jgi:hypothetical protein
MTPLYPPIPEPSAEDMGTDIERWAAIPRNGGNDTLVGAACRRAYHAERERDALRAAVKEYLRLNSWGHIDCDCSSCTLAALLREE